MISALVVATALSAEPGVEGAELPTSVAMYIALLEPMVVASGSSVTVAPINATVRVGGILNGQHALLAGISFATAFLSNSNGVTLSFMPTYRYHLTPLRAGAFSPYVQAELFVGYSSGGGGGSTVPFGFGGSFGAEQMVTRNFGITAAAGLRFIHSEVTGGGGGGGTTSGNQLGIYASAGLALHF